jgi:DNA-binding transcriptional MerR regulator
MRDAASVTHVSIGDVLDQLRPEFSDITISKIRFLESQGLIDPERTASGYRKFSQGDIDRLRFILREQREHFLPLKVIKERLDQLDHGDALEPPEPRGSSDSHPSNTGTRSGSKRKKEKPPAAVPLFEMARRTAESDEARTTTSGVRDREGPDEYRWAETEVILTRTELAQAAGISDDDLAQLEEYGLVIPNHTSRDRVLFDEDALAIARVASSFLRHGIEARHLRMYRAFAEREAGLFEQVLLPYRRQRNPEAQARTQETLGELSGLGRQLRTALLRQAVRRSLMG